jgi:predicted HD superfamily hydrolase involved in NAD metabolism
MDNVTLTEKYLPFLKRVLTPPRLEHSIGVMNVMGELAEVFSLNRSQALIAGLLHDAAKDLEPQHQLALAYDLKINFVHPCEQHPVYLHGIVGAHFVFTELGITDTAILDAISTHTDVGNEDKRSALLSRCLRCADVLAPVAPWNGMKKLHSIVFAKQIEQAELLRSGWLIEHFRESHIPIHPNIAKNYQVLSDKFNTSDAFFERW